MPKFNIKADEVKPNSLGYVEGSSSDLQIGSVENAFVRAVEKPFDGNAEPIDFKEKMVSRFEIFADVVDFASF